ncbi:PilC/PilY family type IV pilus protein [Aquabacterium sp.]|uniref:pilus assembly protein n=1 Tax=Aquabacterium sp. TaxID=1872578 RepID=UPI0025BCD9AB|nr:PilC/PilY family type IV pilus protein [Aquabacterium sp.]
MNHTPPLFRQSLIRPVCLSLGMTLHLWGHTAVTDLASAPLETSTATLVKPNIFFILDDSGSMSSAYLPDWANTYVSIDKLYKNPTFNGVYYDPAVTYTPPVKYDGSSYPSMTSANTSAWSTVPVDGFGVQSTSTTNLATATKTYYVSIAGEYCTTPSLHTCATQSAASTTYPYPATLRWCTNSALSSCQARYISTAPSGGSTYTYPRYPTASISGGTVPGSIQTVTISSSTSSYTYPGSSTRASTRTDCTTNTTTCTYTEEMVNYANWYAYYRTRMQMMKSAASLALIDLSTSYRLGFMSINNATGSDFLDITDITTTSGGQKAKFYAKLFAAKPNGTTPLKKALYTAGRYYAGKLTTINGVTAGDPIEYACQRNYTLLSTDGYWNESTTPYQVDGSTQIGNTDGSESRPYYDGNAQSNTLADIAEYYHATDLRTSAFGNATNRSTGTDVSSNSYSNGQQRMYTYTLGLGASGYMLFDSNYASATSGDYYDVLKGTATSSATLAAGTCPWQSSGACNWPTPANNTQTAVDDLWHAAINGRGAYYSAASPSELKTGLTNFVNAVSAATSNSAAATASTPNLSATSANYVFSSSFCSAKWFGELARYTLDASTGAIASTPDWAQSGAGSDCTSSSGALTTTALLDNLSWSTRKVYTYNPAASSTLIPFEWSSLTSTMQSYFKVAALSSLSQMCAAGSTCLPTSAQVDSSTAGTTTGAGGINLVNYLRGDRSNEGSANTKYYFPRTHVLGDIVDAQAIYVQAPSFSYSDTGYSSFKTANASRQGMVYVGANDGMLHAFRSDTGAESWAYIPSMLLPSLYKLADKNHASTHSHFVNGSLTRADIYVDSAWHTILVGGLGAGGRGFYALDVTDPAGPKVLWEFTHDTSAANGYVRDEDLGYSFGTPIVTKLSDGTWVVLLSSGYNNVSPGSGKGHLWVLNAATGAILHKLNTGLGANASGSLVTGCSVLPCPSGLAKLSAWVDNTRNNTAEYVYGGDLYGNLWRFDITGLTATGGSATVQLLTTLADADGSRQPVTTTPELGYASSQHMVYVGTGRYLGVSDVSTTQTQTMYALKDPLTGSSTSTALYASPRSQVCGSATTSGCFVQQVLTNSDGGSTRTASSTVSYSVDLATMNGWFVDMPVSGERINVDPSLSNGTLVFVSNVPSSAGACSTGGSSYLNYLSYKTGLAVGTATEAGVLLSGTALASSATLIKTTTGNTKGIVALSDGSRGVYTIPTSSTSTATRRLSWRELIIGQ